LKLSGRGYSASSREAKDWLGSSAGVVNASGTPPKNNSSICTYGAFGGVGGPVDVGVSRSIKDTLLALEGVRGAEQVNSAGSHDGPLEFEEGSTEEGSKGCHVR
jgi:hypothetical protein